MLEKTSRVLFALATVALSLSLTQALTTNNARAETAATQQSTNAATTDAKAPASTAKRHHAMSLVKSPKFGPDFKHFDWVNPDAPKGGKVRLYAMGGFDSLNAFSVKGQSAIGLSLIYDQLMAASPDEPSTEYGLIAEWASYPDDFSSATFGLRKEAKFHDGKPVRPEDVIFSLEALKKAHPSYAYYYKNVIRCEKTGENEVTFYFDTKNNRELPIIISQLYVLPEHYWKDRDITKSSLDIPLGSGPYKISKVIAGRDIIYERVADYWAKDLPVVKGQWNFDQISWRYYRDRTPAFEDFKKGTIHYWTENSAKSWATDYEVPPVKKGLIKKENLKNEQVAGMQAFAFNVRRDKFKDRRVREAFNLIYNFEQANKTLFYDQYTRLASFFDNSELAARGKPEGRELEILKSVEDGIPKEVFGELWAPPKAENGTAHRKNLRKAFELLREAGWKRDRGLLRNAKGESLDVEILIVQPTFERVVLPFIKDLKKVGINAKIRIVDSSQYKRRIDNFDYDMVVASFSQSHSPGNEQRNFWGSASAKETGSRNVVGIANPAVDKLIERLVFAKGRDDLVAATRALDRVLLWNFYVIPQWHLPFDRVAYWKHITPPAKLPSQTPAFLQAWWVDAEKADALKTAKAN